MTNGRLRIRCHIIPPTSSTMLLLWIVFAHYTTERPHPPPQQSTTLCYQKPIKETKRLAVCSTQVNQAQQ